MTMTEPDCSFEARTNSPPLPRDIAQARQRIGQILLGIVWIVDGALQLQPFMFSRGFITAMLLPSASGNPRLVAQSITSMAHFLEPHIAVWNALFAAVQITIGLGLLVRRTVRPALVVSFAWSLAVWWFAEGLGGMLGGNPSPLSGAPGAVLLYIVVGLAVWPTPGEGQRSAARSAGRLVGAVGSRVTWAVLWVGSAVLLLQPANLASGTLHDALLAARTGQPEWYSRLLSGAANVVGSHGTVLSLAVAAEMIVVGTGIALDWQTRYLLGAATVIAVLIWVFPEGLGGILTGQGTDPNTGPLLLLYVFALDRGSQKESTHNTDRRVTPDMTVFSPAR